MMFGYIWSHCNEGWGWDYIHMVDTGLFNDIVSGNINLHMVLSVSGASDPSPRSLNVSPSFNPFIVAISQNL